MVGVDSMEDFLGPVEAQLTLLDKRIKELGLPVTQAAVFWGILNTYMESPDEIDANLTASVGGMSRTPFPGIGSDLVDSQATLMDHSTLSVWMALTTSATKSVFGKNEIESANLFNAFEEMVMIAGSKEGTESFAVAALMAAFSAVVMFGGSFDSQTVLFMCSPMLASMNSSQRSEVLLAMEAGIPGFSPDLPIS